MESVQKQIEQRIKDAESRVIFFASDFADIAKQDNANKILNRLCKEGLIFRCARGIYCVAEQSTLFEGEYITPSIDKIAKAVAKRDKARIVPTGVFALNALGLSTQVVMNVVYMTDGASRRISVGGGRGIMFIHTAPKNLAYKSDLVMLIVSALKEIGENKADENDIAKISELLQKHETKENILQDIHLAPAWVREIILKIIN